MGELIADRYEVDRLLGRGGMSSVYKAHDTLLERNVALKILHERHLEDDEYVERFRREARVVAQLSHPNIVTVIDRGEADGKPFIVFEYVDGQTLDELVDKRGALPVDEALEIAIAIARGLAFAHRHGLVHRDVKPQNILLNGDRRPKVTDFGIARSLDVKKGVTQTGTVLGTSNYIAPEQASGDGASVQSDVYSLGVVLFELLTGSVPFVGESFVTVAMQHINEPAPNVASRRRDVPPRVAAAVDRALAKNPRDRFPAMDAFAGELEACLAELRAGHSRLESHRRQRADGLGPAPRRRVRARRRVTPGPSARVAPCARGACGDRRRRDRRPARPLRAARHFGDERRRRWRRSRADERHDGVRPRRRRRRARRRGLARDGRQCGDVLADRSLREHELRQPQDRRRARAPEVRRPEREGAHSHNRHARLHRGRQGGSIAERRADRLRLEGRQRQDDIRPAGREPARCSSSGSPVFRPAASRT